jgi:hypothetical protein
MEKRDLQDDELGLYGRMNIALTTLQEDFGLYSTRRYSSPFLQLNNKS